jgi:uncharacterized damage-inducible protein DinB
MGLDGVNMLRSQQNATWDEEGWFVPLATAIDGLVARDAAWKPPGEAGNSIWECVNHVNYYNKRLLCQLTGESFNGEADNDATFGRPHPEDEAAWQATVKQTHVIADGLRRMLAERPDADPQGQASLWEELPNHLLHDAYHTGQIILLRKLQGSWPAKRQSAT